MRLILGCMILAFFVWLGFIAIGFIFAILSAVLSVVVTIFNKFTGREE